MLPKLHRLSGFSLPRLLKSAVVFSSPELLIKFSSAATKNSQVGFIISSKIIRLAVNRNRLKRQMRQAVNSLLSQIKPRQAILIFAKKALVGKSFGAIFKLIYLGLKQANLIYEKPVS